MSSSWTELVENNAALSPTDRVRVLAQTCAAYSEVVQSALHIVRSDGAPGGRPSPRVARAAATALLSLSDSGITTPARLRAIALLHRWAAPSVEPGRREELELALQACREARAIATELDDLDLVAWGTYVEAIALYRAARHAEAVPVLEHGLSSMSDERVASTEAFPLGAALGSVGWFPSAGEFRAVIRDRLAYRYYLAASAAGQRETWDRAFALFGATNEVAASYRPTIRAQALQVMASRAKMLGDRRSAAQAAQALRLLASSLDEVERPDVERRLYALQVSNAESLKDWQRVYDLNDERFAWAIFQARKQLSLTGRRTGESTRELLAELQGLGDRAWTAAIGNGALGRATAAYRLGITERSELAWDEAMQDLDLAYDAYSGYGANGFVAVSLTRARLQHHAPGGPRRSVDDTVADFLEVTRISQQGAMRRNAAINAVEVCRPGDERVRARLDELIAADPELHGPRLMGARVMLHRKSNDLTPQDLESEALAVARRLEPQGRLLDAVLAAECWLAAAEAARALGSASTVQLSRTLEAIRCLSVQLVSITSPSERRDLGNRYADVIRQAADLATQLNDARAAELIMEAMRRDQVGSLLVQLIADPDVAASTRAVAEGVQLTNTATPNVPGDVPRGEVRRWIAHNSERLILAQKEAAQAAADVLGPLAVLADVNTLGSVTATDLVRNQTTPAAVLQLMCANSGFLASDEPADRKVYWVVTTCDGHGNTSEGCGTVSLPLAAAELSQPAVTWNSYYLSSVLLPEPLRRFLLAQSEDAPVRLTIVPTGLLAVPFDALVLDEELGLQLVDRAAVTVVGSITTSYALEKADRPTSTSQTLAVYDIERLLYARAELSALKASRPRLTMIEGAASLVRTLTAESVDTLAMAVHGSDDDASGWAQTKLLPDGSSISALDLLRNSDLRAPQTCVLASCHSALVAASQVQLGGFPMALLLRGSKTIIGSTYEIPDAETAELMSHFWRIAADGCAPDVALRSAKVELLKSHPELRVKVQAWALVVVYGRA